MIKDGFLSDYYNVDSKKSWYFAKQETDFDKIFRIVKLIEDNNMWGDKIQDYVKNLDGKTNYRCLSVAQLYGLITKNDPYSKAPYSVEHATNVFKNIYEYTKNNTNYLNSKEYQAFKTEQLLKVRSRAFTDTTDNNVLVDKTGLKINYSVYPVLFTLNVLWNTYKAGLREVNLEKFQLFCFTAPNNCYLNSVVTNLIKYSKLELSSEQKERADQIDSNCRYATLLATNLPLIECDSYSIKINENFYSFYKYFFEGPYKAVINLLNLVCENDQMYNDCLCNCISLNANFFGNEPKPKEFFLENDITNTPNISFFNNIYYGAPGTGKSHCVSEITKGHEVIRTTFHPDYDYASFVGAYKPVSEKISNQNNSQSNSSEQIVYRFIAQPFLNAYVEAWKKLCSEEEQDKSVFLVIEELNRGNCAQIFGDVFQLLDRKDNGFSDYSISCDSDIQKYLEESFQYLAFEKLTYIEQIYSKEPSILEELKTGKKLVLPSNLYIYATMNTSDQSLFPIDSAFKRRWSWNYVPITKGIDENGMPIDVSIQIENEKYDWWDFISKINERIESVTNSEDKKLGFFFCKARNGIITADDFVGKALFYIWNDVFKDYGFDDEIFKLNDKCERLKFSSFYEFVNNKTQPNCAAIRTFLKNLGIAIKENTDIDGNKNDSDSEDSATNANSSSVNNSDDSDNEGTTES